ncbi:MAG: TetR/AcrR family transcriptional regulator [Gemmatimonadaceae bacterium]
MRTEPKARRASRQSAEPRRRSGAGESTSESILDVAEQLFSERGFDSVSVKEIAHNAAVNVALIYYHHDSKETLYRHVIQRFVTQLLGLASANIDAATTPEDAIRGITRAQYAMLRVRPHMPRLLIRELIDYHAAHAVGALRQHVAVLFARLCSVIAAGQEEGLFRRDLDPRFAAFSTIAQLPYFFIAQPALLLITSHPQSGRPASHGGFEEAFATHAGDFAVAALRNPSFKP